MEKTVTLRFYSVRRRAEDRPAFADLIKRIGEMPVADRERHITDEGILVRLEDYAVDGDDLCGQFVRGQTGNLPGVMMRDKTDSLPFEEPLGHGIAFRYRTSDGVLAVQYDPRILSPSRIMAYLEAHDARAEYELLPFYRDDAWKRFEELPVRAVEVAIAGRPNVADADDPDMAVWHNVAQMKQQYGADTVRIQLTMGHRKGALAEGAKAFVREAFKRHEAHEEDIRAIKGVIDTGEGVPNEELDLMGELLDVKADLSFPDRDVAKFYTLRRELLKTRIQLL